MSVPSGLLTASPTVRPLWGFSWRGWLALAVLAAMALAAWLGWDPNVQMYKVWAWLFGGDSVHWFAIFVCVYPRFTMLNPQLSLITALVAMVALWLQPGRFPWGRAALLWISAGLLAQLSWVLHGPLEWMVQWSRITSGGLAYSPMADLIELCASAVVLGWAFRSRMVAIVAIASGVVIIGFWCLQMLGAVGFLPPALSVLDEGVLWQVVIGAAMLVDAARKRAMVPRGDGPWCARCLYPIQNQAATVCSECGAGLREASAA